MSRKTVHYSEGNEGTTFCGDSYELRGVPDKRQTTTFSSIPEQVTCKKCQRKLKEEASIQKNLKEFIKKIEKEYDDSKGDFIAGYFEAISNLSGEFNNGRCEDCPFCYETSGIDFESQQPEAILHCSLDRCWIDEVKDIIRGKIKV